MSASAAKERLAKLQEMSWYGRSDRIANPAGRPCPAPPSRSFAPRAGRRSPVRCSA